MGEIKHIRHIIIDGKEYLEDEIPEPRRKQIYAELAARPMLLLGGKPVKKEEAG